MDRRSFIGTFFASLLAPFALKKADAEVPSKVAVELGDGVSGDWPKPDLAPNETLHTDLWEMFAAISEHTKATGDVIFSADNPCVFPPRMGFCAFGSAPQEGEPRSWSITLGDMKKSLDREREKPSHARIGEPLAGPAKADLVSLCIKTSEGRKKLAMAFPGQRKPSV